MTSGSSSSRHSSALEWKNEANSRKTEKLRHQLIAARELKTSLVGSSLLMREAVNELRSSRDLWGRGRGGSRSPLVKFGLALIAFPDPTISDLIGGCIVLAGLAYSRYKPPPIYIEDIYATIKNELKEIGGIMETASKGSSIPTESLSPKLLHKPLD